MLVLVAFADGHVDEREKEVLVKKMAEFAVSETNSSERALRILDELHEEVKAFLENPTLDVNEMPTDRAEVRRLFADALVMALADGEVHKDELEFLKGIRSVFGISDSEFNEIVQSVSAELGYDEIDQT